MVTEALTLVVVMKVPPRRLRRPLTAHGPDLLLGHPHAPRRPCRSRSDHRHRLGDLMTALGYRPRDRLAISRDDHLRAALDLIEQFRPLHFGLIRRELASSAGREMACLRGIRFVQARSPVGGLAQLQFGGFQPTAGRSYARTRSSNSKCLGCRAGRQSAASPAASGAHRRQQIRTLCNAVGIASRARWVTRR